MPRETKFRDEWLDLTDNENNKVNLWCTRGKDDFHCYCRFCKKDIAINNSGKIQVLQHANSVKHKKRTKDASNSSQLKLKKLVTASGDLGVYLQRPTTSLDTTSATWNLNDEEKIIRSEILWILNVVAKNYSFSSCDGINELFQSMFPNSVEAKGLKLAARKISYEISHGLGPYFLKRLLREVAECTFFTLMYDETLNEANKKQLDIHIKFWNNKSNRIDQRYLGSEILYHATALNIDSALMSCINCCKLPIKKLLMLGSDGPNVNKAVFKIMDKRVCDMLQGVGLVNIGTCNLHVVHNAFGEGLKIDAFKTIIEFLEDVDIWFHKYPSRQEDLMISFSNANMDQNVFHTLRYVSNRWLSIVPVCTRVLDLYPALKQHFLVDLVNDKSTLLKCDRYTRIRKVLNSTLTSAYLHFLVSVGSVFEYFLKFLQSNQTLIHILYDEMTSLIRKLLFRFINMDSYTNTKKGEDLLLIPLESILQKENLKYLDVGNDAKKVLSKVQSQDKRCFKLDAQSFYLTVTKYLLKNLPIKNKLLQSLQVLHPLARKEATTTPIIKCLVNMLPRCIPSSGFDKLIDEWRLYISDDDIIDEWSHEKIHTEDGIKIKWKEIDEYWHKVFCLLNKSTNTARYPFLTLLVKAALCLSHGQAAVERGFSINKRMMPADRSAMNQSTIVGLRLIKDGITGKIGETTITREMLNFYREAHSKYKEELKVKQTEVGKCKLEKEVSKVIKQAPEEKFKDLKGSVESAHKLLEEGNKRLEIALKRKSFEDVAAAQALITAGNKKLKVIK